MRIYIFPTGGDSWQALQLAPEDETIPEQILLPAFLQAQAQSQSFPYRENPVTLSDFGFWPVIAAAISAAASYLSSKSRSLTGITGFTQMQQYVVHGLTTSGQFLFCSDDCNKSWRLTLDGAGNISIAERTYAPIGSKPNEPGSNVRFDCALLTEDLIKFISCPATLARHNSLVSGGSPNPTVDIPTWVYWVLGGGLGLVFVSSVGSSSYTKTSGSSKKRGKRSKISASAGA